MIEEGCWAAGLLLALHRPVIWLLHLVGLMKRKELYKFLRPFHFIKYKCQGIALAQGVNYEKGMCQCPGNSGEKTIVP